MYSTVSGNNSTGPGAVSSIDPSCPRQSVPLNSSVLVLRSYQERGLDREIEGEVGREGETETVTEVEAEADQKQGDHPSVDSGR